MNATDTTKEIVRGPLIKEYGDLIWMGTSLGADTLEETVRRWIERELKTYTDPLEGAIRAEVLEGFIRSMMEKMITACAQETHEQIRTRLYDVLVGDEND